MPISTGFYSNDTMPLPAAFQMLSDQAAMLRQAPQPQGGNLSQAVQPPPIPDLFNRFQPPAVAQQPDGPAQPQTPTQPQPQQPTQGGGAGAGAAKLAQAAMLLQMLMGGPGGFYGRAGGGPGSQAGSQFAGLGAPAQGLFDPANAWKPSLLGAQVQGFNPYQVRQQYGARPQTNQGLAPNPDAYQAAITFLQGLLGIG